MFLHLIYIANTQIKSFSINNIDGRSSFDLTPLTFTFSPLYQKRSSCTSRSSFSHTRKFMEYNLRLMYIDYRHSIRDIH